MSSKADAKCAQIWLGRKKSLPRIFAKLKAFFSFFKFFSARDQAIREPHLREEDFIHAVVHHAFASLLNHRSIYHADLNGNWFFCARHSLHLHLLTSFCCPTTRCDSRYTLVYKNEFYRFLIKSIPSHYNGLWMNRENIGNLLGLSFFLLTLILAHESEKQEKNMREEWKRSLFFKKNSTPNIRYFFILTQTYVMCECSWNIWPIYVIEKFNFMHKEFLKIDILCLF